MVKEEIGELRLNRFERVNKESSVKMKKESSVKVKQESSLKSMKESPVRVKDEIAHVKKEWNKLVKVEDQCNKKELKALKVLIRTGKQSST